MNLIYNQFKEKVLKALELHLPYVGRLEQDADQSSPASVLILFALNQKDQLHLLFIKRADHIAVHQGQMAFPGGRVEADDQGDLITTALRETREEVGIPPHCVEVLGGLPDLQTVTHFKIKPIVGILRSHLESVTLQLDHNELSEAVWISIHELLDDLAYREEILSREGRKYLISIYSVRGYQIWGATGAMTKNILDRYCRSLSE